MPIAEVIAWVPGVILAAAFGTIDPALKVAPIPVNERFAFADTVGDPKLDVIAKPVSWITAFATTVADPTLAVADWPVGVTSIETLIDSFQAPCPQVPRPQPEVTS